MAYQEKFFDITILSPQFSEGKPVRHRYASGETAATALVRVLRKTFGTGVKLAGPIETLEVKVRRLETSLD